MLIIFFAVIWIFYMGIKFRDLIFYNREKREIKDPLN